MNEDVELILSRWMSKTCKGGESCCSRDFPCAEVKTLLDPILVQKHKQEHEHEHVLNFLVFNLKLVVINSHECLGRR